MKRQNSTTSVALVSKFVRNPISTIWRISKPRHWWVYGPLNLLG